MPLAGLILGDEGGDGSAIALLPVGGRPLIDYQVRSVHAAGARHIVVLVDQIPALLVVAFDQLRADGIDIDIARSLRDAADRLHAQEAVIVLASGAVATPDVLASIVTADHPVVLTVADGPATAALERIDAHDRWAGIALVDGALVRSTAAMLADWAFAPTLLRRAIQDGATPRRLPEAAISAVVASAAQADAVSRQLIDTAVTVGQRWIDRRMLMPMARVATPRLIARAVPVDLIAVLPLVLTGAALLAALTGAATLGFVLIALASFPAAIAQVMTRISIRPARVLGWFFQWRSPALALACAGCGWWLYQASGQWGYTALALWAAAVVIEPDQQAAAAPPDPTLAAAIMALATGLGWPVIGFAAVLVPSVAGICRRWWRGRAIV